MARSASFKPRHHASRKTSPWSIVIPPRLSDTGKKQERFFKTRALAEGEVKRLKVRKENHGTAAKLLTPADEQQAVSALKLLRAADVQIQLSEVVGDYLKRLRQRRRSKPLAFVWDEYVKNPKGGRKRSEIHKKNMGFTRERLSGLHDIPVADITGDQIEECLQGASASYHDAMLREIRAVFNWAMTGKRKWLSVNPVHECEFIYAGKDPEVLIYTPAQIEKLLDTTRALHPELVPAVAVMAFAGVRPDIEHGEIVRLMWDHVIMKDRHKRIVLPSTITKTRKQRSVPIRPALASWLNWHKDNKGSMEGMLAPYKGEMLRKKLRAIYSTAEVERVPDGLRHSFASYLSPIDGPDIVEAELGHQGGRDTLNKHYRSDVRAVVARKFWATRAPKVEKGKKGKIIQFKAA
jgi:integrase